MKRVAVASLVGLLVLGTVVLVPRSRVVPAGASSGGPIVAPAVHHDVSPPLRDIPPKQPPPGLHARKEHELPHVASTAGPDQALQLMALVHGFFVSWNRHSSQA